MVHVYMCKYTYVENNSLEEDCIEIETNSILTDELIEFTILSNWNKNKVTGRTLVVDNLAERSIYLGEEYI